MKKIQLVFDSTLIGLAGNDLGEDIFKEQVENKIDYKEQVEIVIPPHIEMIAISFVQGFTLEIFKHIPKEDFEKFFIITGNEEAVEDFNGGLHA